jgi:hypothetical protein
MKAMLPRLLRNLKSIALPIYTMSMLILKYDVKETLNIEQRTRECCEQATTPQDTDTGTDDCCYDGWAEELAEYTIQFNTADKYVTTLTDKLAHIKTQRDMWKAWQDEMDKVCDDAKKICHQLEVLLRLLARVDRNMDRTIEAIDLLYCMIKDLFTQIDLLKSNYDYLVACIKCTNNPILVSGQGVMGLIEDYGKKLDAVIATRDGLIDAITKAISLAASIHKSIGHHGHKFGLGFVLQEWKTAFSCDGKRDEDDDRRRGDFPRDAQRPQPEGEFEDTGLEPSLRFPVCESHYYKKVQRRYTEDNTQYNDISKWLAKETKLKDNLKALIDGYNSVLNDPNVNPTKRCAPATK